MIFLYMGIPALFSICSGDSYPFIYEALRRKLAKNSSGNGIGVWDRDNFFMILN